MATTMNKYVQQLQTTDGRGARKVMIDALTVLNYGDCNATSFDGRREEEYLKTVEMISRTKILSDRIKKDSKPNAESENLLMTKGIRSILGPIPFLDN